MIKWKDVGIKTSKDLLRYLDEGGSAFSLYLDWNKERITGLLAEALDLCHKQKVEYEWDVFLNKTLSDVLVEPQFLAVKEIWKALRKLRPQLPIPRATVSDEDETATIVQLNWDRGEHHLDIDIVEDGSMDWFYLNRKSETRGSGDDVGSVK